ncbi:hypothetical protein [Flavobacterium sp. SORGH_AS_0622]|uniref:hypothetical protein n=1 Tax=Flavobacterium sp. SORGH_AS_0622 TaxID=3041772 RepID=UPI00277F7B0C|nr:hypothetical protein [Flavobacterium sp. SORGH_AS_0622]MDQ1165890.1 hypothetical protein [Flavobacterium sp. SORGH_AS_0622]
MSTERKKTRLEQLQQETDQRNFIKSYPVLNKISKISSTDKQLIELVLAYQDNDQPFKMSFGKIADLLGIESKTVSNIVLKLSTLGIVIPDHKANDVVNGVGRGSSTDLAIDIDRIIELVKAPAEPKASRKPRTKKEPASTPEPVQDPQPTPAVDVEQRAPAEPIESVQQPEQVATDKLDVKKAEMKAKFESKFHFGTKGLPIIPADFHSLTNNIFRDALHFKIIMDRIRGLVNNDFEGFWSAVQDLKKELPK